ncbi:hypothetical protein L1049_012047 [Liquidambar formosana]|uniref:HMG box domain-containing protein n=1 Tax=Liquidambar formosana TaxID=63359 RepID=A0AAP0WXF7_LIQFO
MGWLGFLSSFRPLRSSKGCHCRRRRDKEEEEEEVAAPPPPSKGGGGGWGGLWKREEDADESRSVSGRVADDEKPMGGESRHRQRFGLRCSSIEGTLLLTMKVAKGKAAVRRDRKDVLKPVDDRKVGKRTAASKADKGSEKQAKGKLAKNDPNKPKRPLSAFFVFLEEFRKTYKQEHPNVKAVSAVGKAGGGKWKSMSDAEKAPYEAKAAKRKSEYEKLMAAYNKKQESTADEVDESDKSKSEVSDEDDEESGEVIFLRYNLLHRLLCRDIPYSYICYLCSDFASDLASFMLSL